MNKLLLLLVLVVIASCSDRERKRQQGNSASTHQPDSNAVKLSNKAVKLIGMLSAFNDDSLNAILYDSALFYLDRSIETDSLYLMAYTNKAQVFQRRGSLEKALEVLRKVETMKPDFAEVIMGQGFILEKMGKIESANQKYWQALKAYEKRLEDNPSNSVKIQSDIALLYIFLEDQNRALDEIRNLILENPENEELKAMEGYIKNFDRKKFLEEY
jgi:tetratricopeptide (TPR) repeat protein